MYLTYLFVEGNTIQYKREKNRDIWKSRFRKDLGLPRLWAIKENYNRRRVLENPGHKKKIEGISRRVGAPMSPRMPHGVWAVDPRPMWSYPEANHVFGFAPMPSRWPVTLHNIGPGVRQGLLIPWGFGIFR